MYNSEVSTKDTPGSDEPNNIDAWIPELYSLYKEALENGKVDNIFLYNDNLYIKNILIKKKFPQTRNKQSKYYGCVINIYLMHMPTTRPRTTACRVYKYLLRAAIEPATGRAAVDCSAAAKLL